MIPDIGLMIGAYIFTRMVDLARGNRDRVVQLLAILTIIVTIVVSLDLLLRGTTGLELRDLTP